MSLKSKLEAVIYAAEEPVTLTQLATLFAAEALDWKSAQEAAAQKAAADAATTAPIASDGDTSQTMIAEGLEYLDLRTEDGRPLGEPESTAPGFAKSPESQFESESESQSELATVRAPEAPSETGELAASDA